MQKSNTTTDDLDTLVAEILKKTDTPLFLGLCGDLGSGKTTCVQHLAHALGIEDLPISPTYIIEREYSIPACAPFEKLYHPDLYRIESKSELYELNIPKRFHEPAIIAVEWADTYRTYFEELCEAHHADAWWITFEHVTDSTRNLTIDHENSRN